MLIWNRVKKYALAFPKPFQKAACFPFLQPFFPRYIYFNLKVNKKNHTGVKKSHNCSVCPAWIGMFVSLLHWNSNKLSLWKKGNQTLLWNDSFLKEVMQDVGHLSIEENCCTPGGKIKNPLHLTWMSITSPSFIKPKTSSGIFKITTGNHIQESALKFPMDPNF